jgi:hypothetical protein
MIFIGQITNFFVVVFAIYGVLTLWFISGEIQSKQPVKTGNHAFTLLFFDRA